MLDPGSEFAEPTICYTAFSFSYRGADKGSGDDHLWLPGVPLREGLAWNTSVVLIEQLRPAHSPDGRRHTWRKAIATWFGGKR